MRYLPILFFALLQLSACGESDPLVGEFLEKATGESIVRIEFLDGNYFVSEWKSRRNDWGAPYQAKACGEKAYRFVLGAEWRSYDPVGLCKGTFGLVHTRSTNSVPRLTSTGYILIAGLGAIEVYKK